MNNDNLYLTYKKFIDYINQNNLDKCKEIYDNIPSNEKTNFILYKNEFNYSFLIIAINARSLLIAEWLINIEPKIIEILDKYNMNFLFYYFKLSFPINYINNKKTFLLQYKHLFHHKNISGNTILHECIFETSLNSIPIILEIINKEHLLIQNNDNNTCVHLLLKLKNSENINNLIKQIINLNEKILFLHDKYNRNILQIAINNKNVLIIDFLIKKLPTIILNDNIYNFFPLHEIFLKIEDEDFLINIITKFSKSLMIPDFRGILPIHYYIHSNKNNINILKKLIQKQPNIINTLLHISNNYNLLEFSLLKNNLVIFNFFLENYPQLLINKNNKICTILHLIIYKKYKDIYIFQIIDKIANLTSDDYNYILDMKTNNISPIWDIVNKNNFTNIKEYLIKKFPLKYNHNSVQNNNVQEIEQNNNGSNNVLEIEQNNNRSNNVQEILEQLDEMYDNNDHLIVDILVNLKKRKLE